MRVVRAYLVRDSERYQEYPEINATAPSTPLQIPSDLAANNSNIHAHTHTYTHIHSLEVSEATILHFIARIGLAAEAVGKIPAHTDNHRTTNNRSSLFANKQRSSLFALR